MIFGGNCEHRVLDVLIFVYLSLVEALVEVRGIIVLVGYPDANKFRYCNTSEKIRAVRSRLSNALAANKLYRGRLPKQVPAAQIHFYPAN